MMICHVPATVGLMVLHADVRGSSSAGLHDGRYAGEAPRSSLRWGSWGLGRPIASVFYALARTHTRRIRVATVLERHH